MKATLTTEPAKPRVGDQIKLLFAFKLAGGAPTFTLEGTSPLFEGDLAPNFDLYQSQVTWTLTAAKAGRAMLLLKVIYETTEGCTDYPGFVFTGSQAGPFDVEVTA